MYQFIPESGRAGEKRICVGEWRWSTSYGAKFCGALKRNMRRRWVGVGSQRHKVWDVG